MTITSYNKSRIIGDAPNDSFNTRLIGDSIVRGQLVEFCGRAPEKRKRFCIPGASCEDVTAVCDDVTKDADNDTLYIIHAGTNDVSRSSSEELLDRYRRMIRKYKTKSNSILISGILPKIGAKNNFYDKAYSINNRLKTICALEKVDFFNLWDDFYNKSSLFLTDGLHLNPVGAAQLGRLFSEQVALYSAKNAKRSGAEMST